jgi:cytochrome P450
MTEATAIGRSPSGRIAPGPEGYPLLGSLPNMWGDPLPFLLKSTLEHGDIVRLRFGPKAAHVLTRPEHIKYVLQDNQKNFSKDTRGFITLRSFLGMGLLTSDGDTWLRQRRIAQPAFHRQKIAALGASMVRSAEAAAEGWGQHVRSGRAIDVAAEMMKLTLRIAGETLLSTDVSREAETVGRALTVMLREARRRIVAAYSLPLSLPTRRNRQLNAAMSALDALVYRMINERRRSGGGPEDLLAMLLNARDADTGEAMNDKQLRDEVLTIFVAGHETTANALAWTFYLLSKFPAAARKIRAELAEVLGGRSPTEGDLPRLKYTSMVLDESMRLYPPAWMFTRAARQDDEIGGYFIPKGSFLFLSPYLVHRKPSLWEDPEGFDPERFAPERAASIPRFAYFPFGGGPRQCIGNTFALMESVLLLAVFLQKYRLDLVPGHPVELEPLVTLRPKHGVMMTIHAA